MTLEEWLAVAPPEITGEIKTVVRYLVTRKADEQTIIAAVCAEHGVTFEQISGSKKLSKRLSDARHACLFALEEVGFSSCEIGVFFGCDGSTIRHAIDRRRARYLRGIAAE
jgi:chromosomal replication initiation ATPase DnaA